MAHPQSAQVRSKKGFRLGAFLAVAGVALAWNLALFGAYHSWLGGTARWVWSDWLLVLAFMPFAAAGFALAGLAVYIGLPLRNPRAAETPRR